ncbi:MAG: hypothetical protein K1X67_20240 [Fimbriimonadaceae bacterium]|nr:hypothetical protein [Fimbriimonadaceae bacterium]
MIKSLDRKLAAIHADPNCREFILADAKDADMALGLGAPGQSPEMHAGEVRFKTLEEYREQMRLITRQGLVDIMLMSASSNYALTFGERLFDHSHVTPAVRANDTSDIHLARGSGYTSEASRPFRTANIDHIQCGHLDCTPEERTQGANLGLYSVTFNNQLERDLETLDRFNRFREEAERKGFQYFLEVFDPNVTTGLSPEILPHYLNDMITRMLAGVAPAGRPRFLKIVYHGPKAMEELVRFDPHLVVGILGGSSGTTRDAFQLLADAQKYGAKVALFGRKINNSENQLAFVQFLRLIVEGQIGPVDAVKAYHAVLGKLGIRPHRSLEDDLKVTEQSMSYAGGSSVTVPPRAAAPPQSVPVVPASAPTTNGKAHCACQGASESSHGECGCKGHLVTESANVVSSRNGRGSNGSAWSNGRPDFSNMSPADRLAYHRERLGLGR